MSLHAAKASQNTDPMKENLSAFSPNFRTVVDFVEQTLRSYRLNRGEIRFTEWQQNLINWYTQTQRDFAYPERKDEKTLFIPYDKLKRIREIESSENHFLKVTLEMMLHTLVSSEIKKQLWNSVQLYATSALDDIYSGVDAIVAYDIPYKGKTMKSYLGIDYCVTSNKRYQEQKRTKTSMVNPPEFNFALDVSGNAIPRIIKAFDPFVIANMYTFFMLSLINGKSIDIIHLYNTIKKKSGDKIIQTTNATQDIVQEILSDTIS